MSKATGSTVGCSSGSVRVMPKRIPDEAKTLIADLLRSGKTFADVIEACADAGHSVSNGTVANEHKRLGLPARSAGAPAGREHKKYSPHRAEVIRMRDELGMSQEAIAAERGIKRQWVSAILAEHEQRTSDDK